MSRKVSFVPEDRASSNMPFLTLSIFIQLLAFFVVLNTNSEFSENKSLIVIESIDKQFSSEIYGASDKPPASDIKNNKDGKGTSPVEELQFLLTSASISFDLHKKDGEKSFFIRMKKEDFYQALVQAVDGMVIQGKHNKGKIFDRYEKLFLQILTMTSSNNDLNYEMFVGMHSNSTGTVEDDDVEYLINIKKYLQGIDIMGSGVSFGFTPSPEDLIDLHFNL